jgi:hypothetical protein
VAFHETAAHVNENFCAGRFPGAPGVFAVGDHLGPLWDIIGLYLSGGCRIDCSNSSINSSAPVIWAMYLAVAEKQNAHPPKSGDPRQSP